VLTTINFRPLSPLYKEQNKNKMAQLTRRGAAMIRAFVSVAAEITSLALFGIMIAVWALILGSVA